MMKKFFLISFFGILVTFTNQLANAQTQSITVDTTITADCEFYPFSSSDAVYGLSLTGSVNLASDTSLIRVVLYDSLFNEYLVYESYPLIAEASLFNFSNVCDETCYLDGTSPYSIEVQVISATLNISTITYNPDYVNRADSLQTSAKQTVELTKVTAINSFIDENDMLWFADTTSLSNMSYQQKEALFGPKFNLRGFDYYIGGIFIPWGEELREIDNSTLIEEWDWRNRHGANDPTKGDYYYDQNPDYKLTFDSYHYVTPTLINIKTKLIEKGPLTCLIENYMYGGNHAMALVGYGKIKLGDTYPDPRNGNTIEVTEDSPYIGRTYWKFKNSYGTDEGDNGYTYLIAILYDPYQVTYYDTPVDNLLTPETEEPLCFDKDHDGYSNWGIQYDPPQGCSSIMPEDKDSDDSDPRLGPFDEDYYSVPVAPLMEVKNNINLISNNAFYTFYDENMVEGDQMILTFTIENNGNAQLNLFGNELNNNNISISGENESDFQLISDYPYYEIPMGTSQTFQIQFTLSSPIDEPKITTITIDVEEIDMDDYSFNLVFTDCPQGLADTEYIRDTDVSWNGTLIKYGNVQVDNGSTLTIRGNVAFVSGAGLFIEPNAKVYVDGGRLTSLCGSTWQGIDVWGDKYSDQFPDQNGNRTQGFIELMNGGTISNALIGIETTKYDNASALTNYSGGIVIIKDGMIENCEQGVVFYPYKNYHPYAYTHEANLSYFSQTRFYNDKNFPPVNQLKMDGVDGIEIKGCSFENDATPSDYSMPVGIFSISSTFYAGNYVPLPWEGDPVRTTFKNFDKAIFAVNNSAYGNIKIDSVYFEDNLRGIYLSAVDYPVIIQNEFNVRKRFSFFPENLGDDAMIGLYINDPSDGFVVEENEFYTGLHSGKLETTQCAGIHLTNTGGYPNEIYNNKLHDLTVGITAAGSNQDGNSAGLCIKCNDFTRCFNDVYITNEGGTTNLGIATDQGVPVPVPPEGELGDPTQAAGNTFSETDVQNPYNFNYGNFNGCNPVIYTYHGNYDAGRYKLRPEPVFPRPPSQQIDLNKDDNVWYNSKSEACPSNYNGGGIDLMASNSTYSSELVSVNAYEDTLSIFVDGGDTESLTWDVNMSTPPEAVEVRQALLNDSPYLSDTVMKAAIAKEDVLPNAMVRDVLVANPQSAKSTEVLQFLDNRSDTMPGYMMDQVMQGQNIVGAKELLEQNLAGHKTKKGKALKKLMHYYLADTTDFEASNDSIISLLATDNELQSRYKLSLRYLGLKDSAGAYSTFYGIPSEFDLNNEQENEYDLYEDLLDLRWQMIADTATPDSLTIAALFNIEAYYNTAPGVHARNILIGLGELEYDEPVYFPEFNKATPIWRRSFKHNMGASTLKVFPNPAGSYFIAEYKLYETLGTNMLVLTDLNGHNILVINIQKKQNQIVILTSGIKPGVYILQLINGSKVQESVKIAILK